MPQTEYKYVKDGDWESIRQGMRRIYERLDKLEGHGGETTRFSDLQLYGQRLKQGTSGMSTAAGDEFITKDYLSSKEAGDLINQNLKPTGKSPLQFPESTVAPVIPPLGDSMRWVTIPYTASDFRGDGYIAPAGNVSYTYPPDVWGYFISGTFVNVHLALWGVVVAPTFNMSELDIIVPTEIASFQDDGGSGNKWNQGYKILTSGFAYNQAAGTDLYLSGWLDDVNLGATPHIVVVPANNATNASGVFDAGTWDIFLDMTYKISG